MCNLPGGAALTGPTMPYVGRVRRSRHRRVQEPNLNVIIRPVFRSRWLPYVLVAPQLIITLIFFIWPAGEALWYSLQSVDPLAFPASSSARITSLRCSTIRTTDSFWTTIKFSATVTVSGLLISLFFAALVDYVVRGSRFIKR